MQNHRRSTHAAAWLAGAALVATALAFGPPTPATAAPAGLDDDKPKLSLRASPSVAFAPARIYLVAEVKGGPDDYEEFYCAAVEWDWGDGTRSESSTDCEPYEAGKSKIQRRFSVQHRYTIAGNYRIQFRLMRKNDPVAAVSTTVRIQQGIGGGGTSR